MKRSPTFRCADTTPRRAFTLVEMSVAMAILAMIVISLSTILFSTSMTCNTGLQRANNFTKARCMLDAMARDLNGVLLRSDLPAFSNSNFEFYTQQAGIISGSPRQISLVSYKIDSTSAKSTLQRGDAGTTWASSAQTVRFSAPPGSSLPALTQRDTIEGVVGFEAIFHFKDGTASRQYTVSADNPLRAISLNLAVIDDPCLKQLSSDQIRDLRQKLTTAAQSGIDVKSNWDGYLSSQLDWTRYPKKLASGIKTYQRYVTLSTPIR
ncbi:MAG: hypothetical protein B9S32_14785 [Verrucomicrobia bacterium Tous-C9LFEB]|nr:MAG: hypothetical protein B9S32_14785 [Verrucomicrobia bacterium Tous-C9LFEB]